MSNAERVLISSRRALGGHNFVTMTFPSAFAASAAAILVERPARRALLAVYVANEATQARTTPSAREGGEGTTSVVNF